MHLNRADKNRKLDLTLQNQQYDLLKSNQRRKRYIVVSSQKLDRIILLQLKRQYILAFWLGKFHQTDKRGLFENRLVVPTI